MLISLLSYCSEKTKIGTTGFTSTDEEGGESSHSFFLRVQPQKTRLNVCALRTRSAGFTLVELMVSVSVILIIIATVTIQFRSFDSSVLLKTLSYDVAFSVWEARSYALGVRRGVSDFSESYGASFIPGEDSYQIFTYTNANDPDARPKNENGTGVDIGIVEIYKLGRSFQIIDVCVVESVNSEDCTITSLDISFKRPEHAALFYAEGYADSGTISDVRIYLGTEDGDERGVVTVGYAGQITVQLLQTSN